MIEEIEEAEEEIAVEVETEEGVVEALEDLGEDLLPKYSYNLIVFQECLSPVDNRTL